MAIFLNYHRHDISATCRCLLSYNHTDADAEEYGRAALLLGAGRSKKEDVIDFCAGIRLLAKTGDRVEQGDAIAVLYTSEESLVDSAEAALRAATEIGDEQPAARPLIFDTIL